jgi:hypothetical protein
MQEKNQKTNQSKKSTKAEFLVAINDFFDNIKTREQAVKFLQDIGSLDKNEKLTKKYGG